MSFPISPRPWLLALLLLAPGAVSLGDQEPSSKSKRVNRTAGLSQSVYEEMQAIQALIEAGDIDEAERQLQALQATNLTPYELAQTWFIMGYVHFQREEYAEAQAAYEKVLLDAELPLGLRTSVLRTLAQLNMVNENYTGALAIIDELLAVSVEPLPVFHALQAQAHFQLQQFDEALVALERAEALAAEQGDPPEENWLLLKNAVYYQREDFPAMLRVVQQLVRLYPKDRYLLNMAAVYGELGDSEKQLSLLEPLYERGGLPTTNHKVNLASLYLLHEVPYKAARLLEQELDSGALDASPKHLEMLAQAWLSAASLENAVEPLAAAAELDEDGSTHLTLSQTLMNLGRWADAERAVLEALRRGGLRDPAGARILLGMAQFNQKHYDEARRSFAQAGEDPSSADLARRWMDYVEREAEKQALVGSLGGR